MTFPSAQKPSRLSASRIALSLTCLLIGAVLAYVYRNYEENVKLQNVDFVRKQLRHLEGAKAAGPLKSVRPLVQIRVDTASAGAIPAIRTFQGRILEIKNTILSSEVTGLVLDIPVEVGDFVKASETLIARIDETWTRFTYETAVHEIALRASILDYEKSEMERLQDLVEIHAVSQSEFLLQVNKADQIRTNLEIAKLLRDESREKLKRTVIHAPFDGYVIAKMTELGALLTPGNPIVQIVSAGEIDAIFHITQAVVNRLSIGQEITVYVDRTDVQYEGTVHSIVPHAPMAGPRAFPVHIRLKNGDGCLKSGMAVSARVPEGEPRPGIIVPVDAVLDKPDGRTIWVAVTEPAKDERPERVTVQPVPVTLLAHAVDQCSVLPETEAGKKLLIDKAQVIIEGAEQLTPGQTVSIKQVDPRYLENLPSGSGHAILRGTEQ